MEIIAAKKSTGLDGLFKDYVPQQLEEQKIVPVSPFQPLLEKYADFLSHTKYGGTFLMDGFKLNGAAFESILRHFPDTLTPSEINAFLQSTMSHENDRNYSWVTGVCTSVLIQNSYQQGNTWFSLNVAALPLLDFLGTKVQALAHHPITIAIDGDVSGQIGFDSQHTHYIICGNYLYDVGFGNRETAYCTFDLQGDIVLHKPTKRWRTVDFTGERTIIKVHSKKTLAYLLRDGNAEGCRIYAVNKNGKEDLVKDFDDGERTVGEDS